MTTAVYNSNNRGLTTSILSASPINVRIESDARPEEITSFLITLAASIKKEAETKLETNTYAQFETSACDYYCNKYGDEYDYCDNLGFESSYMGDRADFNHIF